MNLPASFVPSDLGYSSIELHLHIHQQGDRWVCYATHPSKHPAKRIERYVPDPAASPDAALVAYLMSYADVRLAAAWPEGALQAASSCEALAKSLNELRVATVAARLLVLPMARRYLERSRQLRALAAGAPEPKL